MFKNLKIENSLKIKNCKLIITSLLLVASCYWLVAKTAFAQSTGITVTPSIAHIDLATDASEYELAYTNNTKSEINLTLSVQDFTELEDSYRIDFLTGKDAANYKYSLSSWISFENKNIELAPGEKKSVKVYIDKNRITKGGHYASILAEIQASENQQQVNIKAVLSSLLFVRASTGKEIEEGKIDTFEPLRDGIDYPDTYILRFENSGNVHVIPYGLIQVFDPLGNLVAKGALNNNSLDALPESIRRYDTTVTTYQKILLPGIYATKIDLRVGKTNQKLSMTIRFFSQGMFDFPKIGFALVIILLVALFLHKKLKTKSP